MPTIRDIPPELILHILENADSLEDIYSLILTSPIFNSILKLHARSVLPVVAARSVECYQIARDLDAELHRSISGSAPSLAHGHGGRLDPESTISAHSRIVAVARQIDVLCDLVNFDANILRVRNNQTTTADLRGTRQAFYLLWRLVRTSTYCAKRENLRRLFALPDDYVHPKPHEITHTCMVLSWVSRNEQYNTVFQRTILRLNKIYGRADSVRLSLLDRWSRCCQAPWLDHDFFQLRRSYWLSIGMSAVEPQFRDMLEFRFEFLRTAIYLSRQMTSG